MPRTIYKQRSVSPAPSSSSQSDIEDDDVNKSTFFPSIEPVTVSPAQWTSRVHLLNPRSSSFNSPASHLPPEILIHVFKQLHSTRDIHSCLFVSRNWCECSVELLWHKPGIAKLPTFIRMMRVLAKTDQTFTYARFIRRLNFLFIGKDLNSALFSRLSHCVRLERLTLVNCSAITAEALTLVVMSCPNLVAIDLTGVTETSDKAIVTLATTCKRLQGINLGGCREVTDEGVLALAANCPLLRRVKLSGIDSISDQAVSALARSCPLLLEIDLNGCKLITDISVRDLWTYSLHMREMRLAQCVLLTDAAFPAVEKEIIPPTGINPFPSSAPKDELAPLILPNPFDHLRMLDLTSCSKITDEAIEGIISCSPKIRNLVLAKCSLLTDLAVESICRLGKHLHYLHLGHTSNITDVSVRQLARTCVRLKYIDLASTTFSKKLFAD
jgi:F-box and leucine-rich repeat protein GRR1